MQDDGEAGAAGKAGEPGQPLLAGRDIFILVGVGSGNEKAVEVLGLQGGAQIAQARGAERGVGGVVEGLEECLEHFQFCKAICRFGKLISPPRLSLPPRRR